MKGILVFLVFGLCTINGLTQSFNNLGISYGQAWVVRSGFGDIRGSFLAISRENLQLRGEWLNLKVRVAGNIIEKNSGIPDFVLKSIGGNVDAALGASIGFKGFTGEISAGPSIRYAQERHIYSMTIINGRLADFEFFDNTGLDFGMVADVNLDYQVLPVISVGARMGTNIYLGDNDSYHQNGYRTFALVLKLKK